MEVPVYRKNQNIGGIKILRILKEETINKLGLENWKDILDDDLKVKPEYRADVIYFVITAYGYDRLTGFDLYCLSAY